MKQSYQIKNMVIVAMFIAIMTCLTMLIAIPVGAFGYINLSDMLICLIVPFFSIGSSVLISGVGCALADFMLGYNQYVLITFCAKALEAIVVYYLINKLHLNKLIAYSLGALVMITCYAGFEVVVGSNISLFITAFLANLPQGLICVILALVLYKPFEHLMKGLQHGSK